VARLHPLAVAVRIDAGEAAVVAALTGRLVHLAFVGAFAGALVGIPLPIAAGLATGIAFGISRLALLAPPILLIERPLLLLRRLSRIALFFCHVLSPDVPLEGGAAKVTPANDGPFRRRIENWRDRNQSTLAAVYGKAALRVTGGM
jgi:hypothetical protein